MMVDNHSTRQYNPEDSFEHHTRRRENLKSHKLKVAHEMNFVVVLHQWHIENLQHM
jgi:hypothetical protein